jgi:GNAT superfamily N-acetyltransferase
MLGEMTVPELVRRAAVFPESDLPSPSPEHPFKQVRRDGYIVGLFPGATFGNIAVQAVDAGRVEPMVQDVRGLLACDGKNRGAWFIAEEASPTGLASRLRQLGMIPFEAPPLEARYAAMALVAEPDVEGPEVEARQAATFDEFEAASRLGQELFQTAAEDRAAFAAQAQRLWELQQRWDHYKSFVALIDGEVVGGAAVIYGENAAFLAGGFTRADMRGRGIYRALIRARWDAAVAHGTPALTVGAGRMSRPILERVGFGTVGWIDCLLDDFESK